MLPGDLVDQFMLYTEGMRSSKLYREWCAITMIGGAMERRIKTVIGPYTNYANLYVMLVGQPGSGKGLIDLVGNIWAATKGEFGVEPAFHCGANDYTKAALIDDLRNASRTTSAANFTYHNLLLAIEEFSNTFPVYDPAILSFLTTIWNGPREYRESRRKYKDGKPLVIEAPLITALIGYQPDTMHKNLMRDANEQGLLRRTVLVWNEFPNMTDLLEAAPLDSALEMEMCSRLRDISLIYDTMQMDRDAIEFIRDWEQNGGQPRPLHEDLRNYLNSRTQLVIKLSMIASMSEDTSLQVHLHHVRRAMSWLLKAEEVMPKVFDSMKGESEGRLIRKYHHALLIQMSTGRPITNAFIYGWFDDKTKPQNAQYVINNLVARGILIQNPDRTWRVTGKTLTDYD